MREERERTQEIGSFPNGSYEEVLAPPEAAAAAAEAAAVVDSKTNIVISFNSCEGDSGENSILSLLGICAARN